MRVTGKIKDNKVVLNENIVLVDGTEVEIDIPDDAISTPVSEQYRHYEDLIGKLLDMPSDLSENHDMYIRKANNV
jgi:hypothetical protein